MAKCEMCGKSGGLLGGGISWTCPNCHKSFCKKCMDKYANAKVWGGLFGDKHMEIICPNCHSTIRVR